MESNLGSNWKSSNSRNNDVEETVYINAVRVADKDNCVMVPVKIEGNTIFMEFDSGDPYSMILFDTMRDMGIHG